MEDTKPFDFNNRGLLKEVGTPKKTQVENCTSNNIDETSDLFPALDESAISLETSEEPMEDLALSNSQYFSFSEDVEPSDGPFFDQSFVSVDPFYSFSAEELKSRVEGTPTRCSCGDFLTLSLTWISSRMTRPFSGDVDDSFSAA